MFFFMMACSGKPNIDDIRPPRSILTATVKNATQAECEAHGLIGTVTVTAQSGGARITRLDFTYDGYKTHSTGVTEGGTNNDYSLAWGTQSANDGFIAQLDPIDGGSEIDVSVGSPTTFNLNLIDVDTCHTTEKKLIEKIWYLDTSTDKSASIGPS